MAEYEGNKREFVDLIKQFIPPDRFLATGVK